ncbi:hypothetical protein PMJ6TS7_47770 [Paenibacillus melissococcoides]
MLGCYYSMQAIKRQFYYEYMAIQPKSIIGFSEEKERAILKKSTLAVRDNEPQESLLRLVVSRK